MSFFLFDLGGVLIELTGISLMNNWTSLSESEIWDKWLHSEAVQLFESGKLDEYRFARGVIEEFELPVDESRFLDEFSKWPKGFYPGAREFLLQLRKKHSSGCLSNTNTIHWKRAINEWKITNYFDYCFPSHKLGLVKPDVKIFELIVTQIPEDTSRIFYYDDNELNVNAAGSIGIKSFLVRGFAELKDIIKPHL